MSILSDHQKYHLQNLPIPMPDLLPIQGNAYKGINFSRIQLNEKVDSLRI